MRPLRFPHTVRWTLLALALSAGIVACKDGGGGGTTPPTPTIGVSLGSSAITLRQGQNNTVTVSVTRGGGYNGAVDLSLEGAPAGVTGTFDPASVPAGSTSSTLTLSAATTAAVGVHNLIVRARGHGVQEKTASLALTVEEPPSISLAVEPAALSLVQATSGTVAVTINRTNFSGAVELSLEGAPAGVTGTFEPASLTGGATTSTLTLTAAADAAVGASELVIRAQGQGIEARTAAVALTVQPTPAISVSVEPTALTLNQGTSGGAVVSVSRTNFTGAVELSLEGAPAGVTGTFAPVSIPPEADASTLTLAIGADAPVGSSELVIRARGEGVEDKTAALALTINPAPAYTLTLDPASLNIQQGASGTAQVQLARTNFTGAVALSVSGAPSGVTVSVSPASTTGNTATLTVNIGANVAPGNYTLTVTGQAQGLENRTVTLQLSVTAAPPTGNWVQVSGGYEHTCAVTADGDAYCWGRGANGRLGNGNTQDQTRPVLVAGGHTWASLSAGDGYTCGITTEGRAYCWGAGTRGQLGNGSTSSAETTPVPVSVSGGDRWTSISTGRHHTCALTTDGRAYCWGSNDNGQLGNGTTTGQTTRVLVAGNHTWKSISAAGSGAQASASSHSCGVTTAGEAYCWGSNSYGQLGVGNTGLSPNTTPVRVIGGHTWASVSAGGGHLDAHTCGVTTSGDAYCWGQNAWGQLGIGNTENQSTPTLVLNDHKWAQLNAGRRNTCGITPAGQAYCWGLNDVGQVGNGSTSSTQTAPALVSGSYTWASITAGGIAHTCGSTTAREAYCWGWGYFGQLGNGSTSNSSTPVKVSDPQ